MVPEQPSQILDAAVKAVDLGVDLDPVAGGDDQRLIDMCGVEGGGAELVGTGHVE